MAVEKVIAASLHVYVKQTANTLLIGVVNTGASGEEVLEETMLVPTTEGWGVLKLAKANAERITQSILNTWASEGTSAIFLVIEKAKAATVYSFYMQIETSLGNTYRLFPNSDRFAANTLTKLAGATHDWTELRKLGATEWEGGEAPKKPSTTTGLTGSEKGKSAGFDIDALALVEEGIVLALSSAASTSSAANEVHATTGIAPGSATGTSSALAAVTAQTLINMATATGIGVAALAASAVSALVLSSASDISSASVNVHAVLEALLAATASTSLASAAPHAVTQVTPSSAVSASGAVGEVTSGAPTLSLQAASGAGSASAVIHAIAQAILAAAASTSSGALTTTARTSVSPNSVSSSSTAQATITTASRVTLAPAASASSALALVTVPTRIVLVPGSSTSEAALTLAAPPTLILAPAENTSSASATVGIYELAPPPYEPSTTTPVAGHIAVGQAGRLSRNTGRIVITEAGRTHR